MNLESHTSDLHFKQDVQPSAGHQVSVCVSADVNLKPARFGMTLIELLIVITILTTLVGGVIPLLSPNNVERKIQGATRSFQTYINLAKAKAARTGRPHGIAIRESSPGSGVALEVFGLEVPPPFAGFSTASAVRLDKDWSVGALSNVFHVQFVLADSLDTAINVPGEYTLDNLPPGFLSFGDYIVIDGVQYRFIDSRHDPGTFLYTTKLNGLLVERVEDIALTYAFLPDKEYTSAASGVRHSLTALKRYQIQRQPSVSAGAPYQFPNGIAIDMQASVTTGNLLATVGGFNRFPSRYSLFTNRSGIPAGSTVPTDRIGIMFSPTGSVDSVSLNGTVLENTVRIALMLGSVENGGIDPTLSPLPWIVANAADKLEVEEKQKKINWLNLDSRILSIVVGTGRSVVNETAFVNLGLPASNGGDIDGDNLLINEDADDQLNAAYAYAREMNTAK